MNYKLGDMVRVKQVVEKGKQPGGGSVPHVVDVTPFDARIIGLTWACEGGNGHPPVQKFECWEVAVDLKKKYKTPVDGGVEAILAPALLTPAHTVPTIPAAQYTSQPALSALVSASLQAAQTQQPAIVASQRVVPTGVEYDVLVTDALNEYLGTQKVGWTAYDITSSLRLKFPNSAIQHSEIRDRVHSQARALLGTRLQETYHPSGAIAYDVL